MPDDKAVAEAKAAEEKKAAEDKAAEKKAADDKKAAESTGPANFGEWLKAQPAELQKLHADDIAGLKSALSSERQQRKDLEEKLREAAGKAEEGSEAKKLLTEQADQLQGLELQAAFYDEAHSQGVSNLSLAWMAAQKADLIDKRGNVNWEQLKKEFPELFVKTPIPAGDAGTGTQHVPAGDEKDINKWIRREAGGQ